MPPCIYPTGRTQTRFGEVPLYQEGLYDLGHQVYAWLVPNGSWGEANAGLVVGDTQSLLIDTLWDVKYSQQMLTAMQNLTFLSPIKTVVNTHGDGDHFWGNQLVKDARILTSKSAQAQMRHHTPSQMALLQRLGTFFSILPSAKSKDIGHWFCTMGAPYTFKDVQHTLANETFSDHLALDIDGQAIELIEVGPAHTQGDVMVYIPKARILFASDILFINCTPVMWTGPVQNWIKALNKILEMDVATIVPGHGPLTHKYGVQLVKDYWIYVSHEAHKRFEKGMSAKRTAYDIVLSEDFKHQVFATWDSPERIMTNCYVLHRHYHKNTKPLNALEIVNILRHQAVLAHELPNASPQSMRRL